MVYCVKCGEKNPDEAQTCSKCGSSLSSHIESRRNRRVENECFGIPHGGAVAGIAIGFIIVMWGLVWFLQQAGLLASNIEVWPIAIIIFGMLLVVGAFYSFRRRY